MSSEEQSELDAVLNWLDNTEHDTPVANPPATYPAQEKGKSKATRQLFKAIDDRDYLRVQNALQNGAGPNDVLSSPYHPDRPALRAAIIRDTPDIDTVLVLLENGANPNVPAGENRETALHIAVEDGKLELVKLLIQYKADLNAEDKNQDTPFDRALKRTSRGRELENHHRAAKILLAQDGLQLDLHPKKDGNTALHNASKLGWVDVTQELLTRGASVDAQDDHGRYPMHYACREGNVKIVLQLLKAGASPDVFDAKGKTPLHVAVAKDKLQVMSELLAAKASANVEDAKGRTAIFKAARNGNVKAIRELAEAGASTQVHDATGRTPLHIAGAHNRGYAIRKLAELGADINHSSHNGSRPLHEAMLYEATNAIDQLLESGAEITIGTGHTGPIRILEPQWERLLRIPFFGQKVGLEGLTVSHPATDSVEHTVCTGLRGAVWPWEPAPYVLATPTVHELLYSGTYHLEKKIGPANTTWIHLPANNRLWIQDIFKVMYGEDREPDDVESIGDMSGAAEDGEWKEEQEKAKRRQLSSILAFIDDKFSEDWRKNAGGIKRTRKVERRGGKKWYTDKLVDDQMIAVAIPVIDIDLRKPYYDRSKIQRAEETPAEGRSGRKEKSQERKPRELDGGHERHATFLKKIQDYTSQADDDLHPEESKYDDLISKLVGTYSSHGQIDLPVSLDQYFHESIDEVDINLRNGDQVISRFIARQRAEREEISRRMSGQQTNEAAIGQTSASVPVGPRTPSHLEAGWMPGRQQDVQRIETQDKFRQRILTVPKFWIWKLDENTIVTSFPQRRDQTSGQNHLMQAVWLRLTEMIINDDKTPGRKIAFNADAILQKIVNTCLEFQPSFFLAGKEYNYPDVFSAEIAFVSRQVSHLYNTYEASLGNGVKDFSRSIKLATECLINIEDILNEMAMIRRVMRDQGRVLLSLQTTHDAGKGSDEGSELAYDTAEWGFEGMRSTEIKHVIARLKHLEKDANMVRKSISTLLDLRQRQVAIDMAMSSEKQSDTLFRQSSILFIFTAATVLFAPLAWVSSFMALDIDQFSPEKWAQGQVVGAHIGSGLVTWILCALGLLVYLRHLRHQDQSSRSQVQ